MRTLEQALLDHELIVLRVIGEWLRLDLTGTDKGRPSHNWPRRSPRSSAQRDGVFGAGRGGGLTDLVRQGGRAGGRLRPQSTARCA